MPKVFTKKRLNKVKENTKHKYYTDLSTQSNSDCLNCKMKKETKHLRTKKLLKRTEESFLKKNIKKSQHSDIFKNAK